MKFQFVILFFLAACSKEAETSMVAFQDQSSVVIVLEELEIKEIPEQIGELTKAQELTIQKARSEGEWSVYPPLSWYENRELEPPFREIPETIGELQNLKSLNLVDLDIRELPGELTQLQHLEFLDLSFNKLELTEELSKFRELKSLKHLRVLGNHFDEAEMQQFKSEFPNLKLEYKAEDESHQ